MQKLAIKTWHCTLRSQWTLALALLALLSAPAGVFTQPTARGAPLPIEQEEESRPLTEHLQLQAHCNTRNNRRWLSTLQDGHLVAESQIHKPSFAGQGSHSSDHSLLSTESQSRNGFGGPLRC